MSESSYTIKELTEQTGLSRRTIHFYTQQGVLPPPTGAGLGARYGEGQLLRLKLVPVLRRQGLRLDEIRERFAGMSLDEMREVLATAPPATRPAVPMPLPSRPIAPAPGPPSRLSPHPFTHYPLPAGVTVVAPTHLGSADRQKLSALLDAAARIFGRSIPIRPSKDLEKRQGGDNE